MNDWVYYLDKAGLVLIGAVGGLVRWVTLREHWGDGLISIFVGGIMSGVFAEPLAPVLLAATQAILKSLQPLIGAITIDPTGFTGPAGFLIGVGGIALSGLIIDLWRAFRHKAGGSNGSQAK